ncbi:MAG: IS66 family transposase, partial [Oscillospiraceae bacterium]|nr:IS66 family transposase [Oscillospiraceae bacterium]
ESERICPECGDTMSHMGTTVVRNELKIVPAQVINVEHTVDAYECTGKECEKCNGKQIIRAEVPEPLMKGSLASPSAVAHIATQKYFNRIPLYQIEKGLIHDGVVLSRQVMSNWLIYCAMNLLIAIYSLLKVHLLIETIQHADETTLQVLHEPGRAAKTKSYEWLYRTSGCAEHQIVIYEYQMTRSWDHPKEFLKNFKGYLHTDGYDAYHDLPDDIIVVGCWSHARRPWEDLYESIPVAGRDGSNAERDLVYINLLFALEHEYTEMTPEERFKQRLKRSKPVSDDYFEWVDSLQAPPKTLLGKAIDYSISQRVYLENIYLDGRLEISNNRAERSIKPFVQGRKQWLFSNTPNGAESSSIYFSLIETARENNLNPYQYLRFLLEKLSIATTADLESLLPWGDAVPDSCKVPVKTSNIKQEQPKYSSKKGPLHNALQKLRAKYAVNVSS